MDLCFQEFGDRVKHWITINEPNLFSSFGYAKGIFAPGRCSNYIGNCSEGNSAIEPYLVTHHLILSHATAAKLYRNKYQVCSCYYWASKFGYIFNPQKHSIVLPLQGSQKGIIGITADTVWQVPKYQTDSNRKAASRALDFYIGWWVFLSFLHYIL